MPLTPKPIGHWVLGPTPFHPYPYPSGTLLPILRLMGEETSAVIDIPFFNLSCLVSPHLVLPYIVKPYLVSPYITLSYLSLSVLTLCLL